MVHVSTETLSRPAARIVRAAPQTSSIALDTALLAACRELHKQRRRLIATGRKATPRFLDLLNVIRQTPAHSDYAAEIRAGILEPAVPALPLTGSNAAVDAAIQDLQRLMEAQTERGREHTRSEEALLQQNPSRSAKRAEAKADRAYVAAQEAVGAARIALLETEPATLLEARIKLHAHVMSAALDSLMDVWWRDMSLDEARDVVWSANYNIPDMTMGLEAYAADVDRLTNAPAPPTSDSTTSIARAPVHGCAVADLLPAFTAAYATRDTDFAAEERIAEQVCKANASSLTGLLFQLSMAHRYLGMSNDFEHGPGQEELFQLGQTALLNAAQSLGRISGIRLRECGWDLNEHAQIAGLPL